MNSDQNRIELNLDDRTIRLKAANANSLNETNAIALGCGGFETEEDAYSQGTKLMNCLSVCGAILKIGIDTGKAKILSGAGQPLKEIFEKVGAQLIDDVFGLSVYRDDIETGVISANASIICHLELERVTSALEKAYSLDSDFTKREKIAFDLYNSSFFEATTIARFLTLVSVLEVLSIKQDMDKEVIELIDCLIAQCKFADINKDNYDSVVNRLSILKKQSISYSIRQLLRKHLGNEKAKWFDDIYKIRSGLLHDGVLRCSESDFRDKIVQLNNMVSDLLLKTIETRAPKYMLHPTSNGDAHPGK